MRWNSAPGAPAGNCRQAACAMFAPAVSPPAALPLTKSSPPRPDSPLTSDERLDGEAQEGDHGKAAVLHLLHRVVGGVEPRGVKGEGVEEAGGTGLLPALQSGRGVGGRCASWPQWSGGRAWHSAEPRCRKGTHISPHPRPPAPRCFHSTSTRYQPPPNHPCPPTPAKRTGRRPPPPSPPCLPQPAHTWLPHLVALELQEAQHKELNGQQRIVVDPVVLLAGLEPSRLAQHVGEEDAGDGGHGPPATPGWRQAGAGQVRQEGWGRLPACALAGVGGDRRSAGAREVRLGGKASPDTSTMQQLPVHCASAAHKQQRWGCCCCFPDQHSPPIPASPRTHRPLVFSASANHFRRSGSVPRPAHPQSPVGIHSTLSKPGEANWRAGHVEYPRRCQLSRHSTQWQLRGLDVAARQRLQGQLTQRIEAKVCSA